MQNYCHCRVLAPSPDQSIPSTSQRQKPKIPIIKRWLPLRPAQVTILHPKWHHIVPLKIISCIDDIVIFPVSNQEYKSLTKFWVKKPSCYKVKGKLVGLIIKIPCPKYGHYSMGHHRLWKIMPCIWQRKVRPTMKCGQHAEWGPKS